ncbi:MAG: phosphonate ABC transporter, permease protein PhnE [Roseibium album]|uniref:Phosphate-import permease protein PhnE n=1 Tax=Roseibium album TaxID=311410 RepID=A0A0M7B280_9HYPH|nr:phosphonate ABC transporter, permease protein PhnE [Roseibium album]MBG6147219.1 phosphonate transport system permease protein [Labrenzia sp. EL_142]MBG6165585.1 phosphonate transport system permease protein [Labrenzia sp. EL_195]MBG6176459.1 phosphonate transport system permease protein [Labrenzia sp. EL_132]MBG6210084.1 phosphonate transport system permease protein [Labrenzia sp. EL_126]MBG6231071.1 phosphonate transport system permease protein [Labrenzia sp. EL_208]
MTDQTANSIPARKWSRFKYPDSLYKYGTLLIVLVFLGYSFHFLNIDITRLFGALGRLMGVVSDRYYPPDLEYVLDKGYLAAILDTLQMSFLGGFAGVCIAIPLAWFSAANVSPARALFPVGRLGVIFCRAIHETIWTILFVSILGFGMLAGVSALTMFCIGFAGKLFADEIEAIEMGPVEAMRAAGANPFQVFLFAVVPQVRVAFTGIAIYTWDVAFRAATVVGFFGGGGMGWYLKRNVQQLENLRVAAIILSIIAMVLIAEFLSGYLRSAVNRAK